MPLRDRGSKKRIFFFARALMLLAVVFSFSGCNSSSSSLATSISQFLGIQNVISGFDVPSSSLAGGSSVTLSFSVTPPSGSQVSQIKLQYATDGSTFKDVDLSIPTSATSINWSIPKTDATNARLKLIVITDSKSQASEISSAFNIDSTPPSAPTISLSSANPAFSTSALFTVAHCSDIAWIFASESATALADLNSALALSTSDSDGWQKCSTAAAAVSSTLTSGAGNKTVYFWAKDAAGNISATSSSVSVTLDPSAPTASFSSPASGTAINSLSQASFTITGACSVNGGSVSVYLSDGVHTATSTTTCNTSSTPNWSVNVNAISLSDTSSNGITATVIHTNLGGISSSAITRTFNKNTGTVSVSITSPTTGGYSNNSNTASFTVSGACSVHGQTVSVSASDGSTALGSIPTCDTSASPQWSTTLNLTALGANITFNASHSDGLGSTAHATAVSISKDLSNPNNATSPTWVQASPSTSNTVTASWTPSNSGDLASQSLQYYSDGTCTTASGAPVSTALTSTRSFTGTSGTWSYKVISSDAAGNTNTSACSTAMVLKEASLAQSALTVSHSSIVKGQASTITLTIKDPSGVRNTLGGYTVTFSASAGAGVGTGTISATTDHGNGTYTATFTGSAKGTATTISAAIATVGTVTQTQSITVGNSAPVITPLATSTYPLNQSTPPVIQGSSVTLATASDADSDTVTLSCTYQTLGLNALDPNYAVAGTNCNTLNTMTTSGSPSTVVTGKLNSTTTGTLSWTPTLSQRGTYQFTINATDGTANATARTVTVTVRAAYTTTNLLSAIDALNSTNASGLSSSTASAPFTTAATAGSWLNLLSSSSNGALTFGTTNPWGGTGQSSTSSVDPYALTFNKNNSDSLSLGTALSAATQFSTETWVKPSPLPSASPAPIIIGNGGGTGNGFALRQSQITPDRAEFVVGQKYYSYRDLVLSDKPVGYWRLGETSGTTAYDLTAYGNNGTYTGGYTLGNTGIISGDSNTGVHLDGSSGYVAFSSSPSPIDLVDRSIEAWIKPTNLSSVASLVDKDNASAGWGFWLRTNGKLHFWLQGGMDVIDTGSGSVQLNQWNHVAVTYSTSSQTVNFYINGVLNSTKTNTGTEISSNGCILAIGRARISGGSGIARFPGSIDEVAMYNYALTPTQITEHYQTGLNGNYKPYPGNAILADKPLGYWRLGEKTGSTAYDSSGNNYHATYTSPVLLDQTGAISNDSNSSAFFNGTGTSVDAGNITALNSLRQTTLEAWVKTTTHTAWVGLVGKSFSNSNRIFMGSAGPGYGGGSRDAWISFANGSSHHWAHTTTNVITTGVWQHWVAVFNGYGAANADRVKFYINGVQQTLTIDNSPTTLGTNTTSLTIGASSGVSETWKGYIDEVAIYNYALSPTQIAAHYNSGNGPGWWTCQSQTQLSQSNWNLLSTLYDGTTARLFVNGQQECSVTPGTAYSGTVANTVAGSNPGRTSNFWQGLLSSIKIFGTGNSTAPATSTTIKTNFDSEANRYRSTPVENIVTSGLVLNLDAANANQGIAPYANGCASSDLSWFDLSSSILNGTLQSFSSCSSTSGWTGSGATNNPYALALNGSSNYALFPWGILSGNAPRSMMIWFKTSSSSTQWYMSWGDYTTGLHSSLGIYNSGTPSIGFMGSGGDAAITPVSAYTNGSWHHMAYSFDGTSSFLLIDGVEKLAKTQTLTNNTSSYLTIGKATGWAGGYANGSLAVGQVYNRALTIQEIKQNCLAQEGRFTNTPQSICAAP